MKPRTLTPRQREVVACLRLGLSNREIGQRLGITEGTVKIHLHSALGRTGLRNRTELALQRRRD